MTQAKTYEQAYQEEKSRIISELDAQHERILESVRLKDVGEFNEERNRISKMLGWDGFRKLSDSLVPYFLEHLIPIKGVEVGEGDSRRRYLLVDGEIAGVINVDTTIIEPTVLDKKGHELQDLDLVLGNCEKQLEKHRTNLKELSTQLFSTKDEGEKTKLETQKVKEELAFNRCSSRLDETKKALATRNEQLKKLIDKKKRVKSFSEKYGFEVFYPARPMK